MNRVGLVGALLLVSACAAPLQRVEPNHRALRQEDVAATALAIAKLRGWKIRRMPRVSLENRDVFVGSVRALEAQRARARSPHDAFATLFGLEGRPGAKPSDEAELRVRGFYEPEQEHVHVLAPPPRSEAEGLSQHGVLAHELIHALQDQQFKLSSGAGVPPDERLAYTALIEGDASAAQLAYGATLRGLSVSRALRRARYSIAHPERVSPAASPTADTGWASAPQAAATLRAFPYEHGLAFVVDLYRAGGFGLVDQAYLRTPRFTEHVLHPEKYLSDEQPLDFAQLVPPSGFEKLSEMTLGELHTRIALEPCAGRDAAIAAAAGWNGDRAFVLAQSGKPLLGWVSAWDTEGDAEAMASALTRLSGCIDESVVDGQTVSSTTSLRREGAVVAFVRGGMPTAHEALLDALLALPGPAVAAAPFTKLTIPPLRKPPEPNAGRVTEETYRNEFLGITSVVEAPLETETLAPTNRKLDLLKLKAPGAGATLSLSLRLAKPEHLDATFDEWEGHLVDELASKGDELVRYGDPERFQTPIGLAYRRRWAPANLHRWIFSITVVPICGGAGSLRITTYFVDGFGFLAVQDWIKTLRWLDTKQRAPVCEYLDPERTR